MKQSKPPHKQHGLTLVELMIVLVVVGILAALVMPSFSDSVRESHRQDAQKTMLQLKLQQESYRLDNTSYASSAELGMPASDRFTFTVENVSATTFTLVATAKGEQLKDTDCTTMRLSQSMDKTPAACW